MSLSMFNKTRLLKNIFNFDTKFTKIIKYKMPKEKIYTKLINYY